MSKNIDNYYQLQDDSGLLNRMMKDMASAGPLYKPTNYWKHYEKFSLRELASKGLHDFRRRRHTILESFGATDTFIRGKILPKLRFPGCNRIICMLEDVLWHNPIFPFTSLAHTYPEWITAYFYYYVKNKFKENNLDLDSCPMSLYGNPEDVFLVNDRPYSFSYLGYCSLLADAAKYINFHDNLVICELGAGLGKNIEVIAKLFPSATVLLIDIPPQLYVSNQYLSSVFKERVVAYEQSIYIYPENDEVLRGSLKGKIIILPTWLMPRWAKFKIDLFWNSGSFQEMEPGVVNNYLRIVKEMQPRHIYINANPEGNYWGEWKPGRGGTKERVLGKYYLEYLEDCYNLKKEHDTDHLLQSKENRSYIFEIK